MPGSAISTPGLISRNFPKKWWLFITAWKSLDKWPCVNATLRLPAQLGPLYSLNLAFQPCQGKRPSSELPDHLGHRWQPPFLPVVLLLSQFEWQVLLFVLPELFLGLGRRKVLSYVPFVPYVSVCFFLFFLLRYMKSTINDHTPWSLNFDLRQNLITANQFKSIKPDL